MGDYRDLEVWRLGCDLVAQVYRATRSFPSEERYGLIIQMRRAAISIPSNIAEGWARHYTAEFIQFLRNANGSRAELETQWILSAKLGYLTEENLDALLRQTGLLGRKLLCLERSLASRTP